MSTAPTPQNEETHDPTHPETIDARSMALINAGRILESITSRFVSIKRENGGDEALVISLNRDGTVRVNAEISQEVRRQQLAPQRLREKVLFEDAGSLAEWVNRFKTAGTVIFADPPSSQARGVVVAIADYSADRQHADWNRQRATISCELTSEVSLWLDKVYTQEDFADLVDDVSDRLTDKELFAVSTELPTANQLLGMTRDLQVSETKVQKVKVDPRSGLVDVRSEQGASAITTIYPAFGVLARVFPGLQPVALTIRLRLVKRGTEYMFGVSVMRWQEVLAAEFKKLCDALHEKTGVPVWQGTAPPETPVS